MAIFRSRAAREDVDQLWLNLVVHDFVAADRLIDDIDFAILRLKDYPEIGRDRSDIRPGLRGLLQGKTIILYRIERSKRRLEILRIVDGRRDLTALF